MLMQLASKHAHVECFEEGVIPSGQELIVIM